MATSGVFVLSLCYIYLSLEPVGTAIRYTPDGYRFRKIFRGFYKLHLESKSWDEARIACEEEDATLGTPFTVQETLEYVRLIKRYHVACGLHVGANETFPGGEFYTLEGVPLCRLPYEYVEEEGPKLKMRKCLVLLDDGSLVGDRCSAKLPFVCYKKEETCDQCRFPCKTVDNAYIFSQRTGSCYKFHDSAQEWIPALRTCYKEGGYLAIINSQVEAEVLRNLFNEYPPSAIEGANCSQFMHVGFHNYFGGWRNIDGKNLKRSGYSTWFPGEPNNSTGNDLCGAIYHTGELNDINCNLTYPFVCEKDTPPICV